MNPEPLARNGRPEASRPGRHETEIESAASAAESDERETHRRFSDAGVGLHRGHG